MTRTGKTQSGRASDWTRTEREASRDLGTGTATPATLVSNVPDPSGDGEGNPLLVQAFFVAHWASQVRFGRA